MQKEIEGNEDINEEDKPEPEEIKWKKDEEDDDAEVVKLEVGESIEGLYTNKVYSGKYSANCFSIKPKEGKTKVILATTILDKKMSAKNLGDLVKIVRTEDGKNQAGVTYQNYDTFSQDLGE